MIIHLLDRLMSGLTLCTCTLAVMSVLIPGCSKSSSDLDFEIHKKSIEEWQQKQTARLTNDTGWLTLFGLFWLNEGENTFGSDSSNDIIFPPGKAPKFAGTFWLKEGVILFESRADARITLKDSIVKSYLLMSDEDGLADATVLGLGPLSFFVIKRGSQFGIRARDKDNPGRKDFKGLEFFPIDPKWRIEATFERYDPPKIISIATIIHTVENDSCPGALVFEIDGTPCRLDAVMERGTTDELFVMFRDETSGKETYGLGRQLYAPMPKENKVLLDFNKCYNWPCVYTDFATCPIPPKQNRLAVRVEAGEKMYK